jgi:hypothetical protein
MDELHLTRSGLESMSTAELVRVADSFGIDIPPGLNRVFVIGELLDLAFLHESLEEEGGVSAVPNAEKTAAGRGSGEETGAVPAEAVPETLLRDAGAFPAAVSFPGEDLNPEDSPRSAPAAGGREGVFGAKDFPGSVPFPRQYNITFVEVMIRDPLWTFAFWEVKEHDRETLGRIAGFEGYCLRVNPLPDEEGADSLGFTVPVGPEDTAWYIGFPSENTGRRFQVELCARLGERIDVLASSRIFTVPKLQERAGLSGQCFDELALLSGAEEFPILRNPERKARFRYGREARRPGR